MVANYVVIHLFKGIVETTEKEKAKKGGHDGWPHSRIFTLFNQFALI